MATPVTPPVLRGGSALKKISTHHPNWPQRHQDFIAAARGFRNGIITGVRIRMPYVIQSVVYALMFRSPNDRNKIKFVIKQMFQHGKNLGLFVGTYKTICYVLRKMGVNGGLESWIAGFIGGFTMFGSNKGISGSVNNQIVLYLFARGIHATILSFVKRGYLPAVLDLSTPLGFRIFAGFSLALILYMTEYEPENLSPSFMGTMNFLYYDSDARNQNFLPTPRFLPFFALVTFSLLGLWFPSLTLKSLLSRIIG